MRLPDTAHTSRPWRIHELTGDFRLEDVWALPTPGGPDDFPRLVRGFPRLVQGLASADPSRGSSRAARALWAIRWKLGELLGWDRPDAGLGARVPTLRDRLPTELREAPSGPDLHRFSSLYLLEDEWAAEIANRTVHGVLHIGWVPEPDGLLPRPDGRPGEAERAVRDRLPCRDQALPAPDRVPGDAAGHRAGVAGPRAAAWLGVSNMTSPDSTGRSGLLGHPGAGRRSWPGATHGPASRSAGSAPSWCRRRSPRGCRTGRCRASRCGRRTAGRGCCRRRRRARRARAVRR